MVRQSVHAQSNILEINVKVCAVYGYKNQLPELVHNNFDSLYCMKNFSFGLAVINVCPALVPSEYSFTDLGGMDS